MSGIHSPPGSSAALGWRSNTESAAPPSAAVALVAAPCAADSVKRFGAGCRRPLMQLQCTVHGAMQGSTVSLQQLRAPGKNHVLLTLTSPRGAGPSHTPVAACNVTRTDTMSCSPSILIVGGEAAADGPRFEHESVLQKLRWLWIVGLRRDRGICRESHPRPSCWRNVAGGGDGCRPLCRDTTFPQACSDTGPVLHLRGMREHEKLCTT